MATANPVPPPLPDIFLDPYVSLLALPEDHEHVITDVREALEALSWLGNELASVNVRRRQAGESSVTLELPPEGFSALMRVLSQQLELVSSSPAISRVLEVRPDLCNPRSPS